MPRDMNFNMITLKDLENFVKKFPELEFINKKDCYGNTQHYCVMKELRDFVVFDYHNGSIFLYQDFPIYIDSKDGEIYHNVNANSGGKEYYNLNEMEKPLKKVIFMFDYLILLQKKMKMYEKKLDVEKDFKE